MSDLLAFEQLTVGYQHRRQRSIILQNVTASVGAGEMVGLVGPNGVGKSTLLRSVAGLQPSFTGSVTVMGKPLKSLSKKQRARRMAAVLTDRFEPGRLSVRDVVGLGRFAHSSWTGRLTVADRAVVDRCLELAGAQDLADRLIGELSDGQRQRVMVARGLAQEPRILLLDEPTAFLDPPGRVALFELLRKLSEELAMAVVVCTHDIEIALRYADSLWVADRSRELIVGSPEQLAYDGHLGKSFQAPGVELDLASLAFVAVRDGLPKARVTGEAAAAAMAKHCLVRAGFELVSDTDTEVTLSVAASAGCWTMTPPGLEVTDLGELYDRARGISNG